MAKREVWMIGWDKTHDSPLMLQIKTVRFVMGLGLAASKEVVEAGHITSQTLEVDPAAIIPGINVYGLFTSRNFLVVEKSIALYHDQLLNVIRKPLCPVWVEYRD